LTSSDIKLVKTGGQNNKEIWNNEICMNIIITSFNKL
jgi:hypothetical protein